MTAGADAPGSAAARQHLLDFVKAEVTAEEQRRVSLESRGLSLVTVAGVLVTVLTAVASIVTKQNGYAPTWVERIALIVGAAALIGAVGLGVATNGPRRTDTVDPDALLEVARERWADAEADVQATVLASQLRHLRGVQRTNDAKGALLVAGMATLAVAAAGMAVGAIAALLR